MEMEMMAWDQQIGTGHRGHAERFRSPRRRLCGPRTGKTGYRHAVLDGHDPHVKRLADAFRKAGRPVVYVAHVLKPDYSDAQFPYWRLPPPPSDNSTFVVEGAWGAQIVDDLRPREGEHLVVRKASAASRTRRSTQFSATWA